MNTREQEFNFFLPVEIMLYMISFLDVKDILLLSRVSKDYYNLVNDDSIWKKIFQKIAGDHPVLIGTYKNAYKNLLDSEKKCQMAKEFAEKCNLGLQSVEASVVQVFLKQFILQQTALSWTDQTDALVYAATLLYKYSVEENYAPAYSSHFFSRAQNTDIPKINDFLKALRMGRSQIVNPSSDLQYLQDLKSYVNNTQDILEGEQLSNVMIRKIEKVQKKLLPTVSYSKHLLDSVPDSPRLR